jgi:PIN domain nuclease of toxin-antitoxin system
MSFSTASRTSGHEGAAGQTRPAQEQSIRPLAITHAHALAVADLPPHHRDPFDRMLVAQARLENLVLVTRDPVFGKYDCRVAW